MRSGGYRKAPNDIRVGINSRIRNVVRYCSSIIRDRRLRINNLNFSAVGGAINKLQAVVRIIKLRFPGFYQFTRMSTVRRRMYDNYNRSYNRYYPRMRITLSYYRIQRTRRGFGFGGGRRLLRMRRRVGFGGRNGGMRRRNGMNGRRGPRRGARNGPRNGPRRSQRGNSRGVSRGNQRGGPRGAPKRGQSNGRGQSRGSK